MRLGDHPSSSPYRFHFRRRWSRISKTVRQLFAGVARMLMKLRAIKSR
jgi:hypothetical protein